MLDETAAAVDAQIDAVGRHSELQLARDARSEVAAAQSRRKEQHVRANIAGSDAGPLPASLGAVTGIAATSTGNLVISVENAVLDVLLH